MEIFSVVVVTSALAAAFGVVIARQPRQDHAALWAALLCHLLLPHALWWLMTDYYGGREGDSLWFFWEGERLSEGARIDPERFVPMIGRSLIGGTSTTFMVGLAAVLLYIFSFPSVAIVVVSAFAFSGQLAIYWAVVEEVPAVARGRAVAALLLVPSALFWTSGLVKEAVAIGGLGWTFYGVSRIVRGTWRTGLVPLAIGVLTVARSKSYILFPMAVGGGLWVFWSRQNASQRHATVAHPARVALGLVAGGLGVVLLSYFFPQYSLDQFADEASRLRGLARGGSSFSLSAEAPERSLTAQLLLAPVGTFSSLFRPLPFEARNVLMLLNSVETTAFVVLAVVGLVRAGPTRMWARTIESPVLVMCGVFVLLFAVAVGLTTQNFGTLSRYRVPMLPFWALWLLVVGRGTTREPLPRARATPADERGGRTTGVPSVS